MLHSICSCSSVLLIAHMCLTLYHPMDCSLPASQSLLKLMSIESMLPSNHLLLCRPLLLLPSVFPNIRVFSNESTLWWGGQSIGVSASASVLAMNIQDWFPLGLTDWLDLLAVQRTVKSLLQHHSSKGSVLLRSTFFIVQLSHPYTTTGNIISLTRQTFVSKVISMLFNMMSKLVIVFLPRSKHLLISWLQSPSAVILEPKKIYCFHCFPIYLP